MIKKEIQCYECGYSGKKYDSEEECLKSETAYENTYNAESDRFSTFRSEVDGIVGKKNEKTSPDEELPVLHCSKCLKLIHEGNYYVEAFGYKLCLCCAIPMLKTFAKNYMTFKTQFANQVNLHETRSYITDCDAKVIYDSLPCNCNSTTDHIH